MKTPNRRIIIGAMIGAGVIAGVAAALYYEDRFSVTALYGPISVSDDEFEFGDEFYSESGGSKEVAPQKDDLDKLIENGVIQYKRQDVEPTLYGPAPVSAPEVDRVDIHHDTGEIVESSSDFENKEE